MPLQIPVDGQKIRFVQPRVSSYGQKSPFAPGRAANYTYLVITASVHARTLVTQMGAFAPKRSLSTAGYRLRLDREIKFRDDKTGCHSRACPEESNVRLPTMSLRGLAHGVGKAVAIQSWIISPGFLQVFLRKLNKAPFAVP